VGGKNAKSGAEKGGYPNLNKDIVPRDMFGYCLCEVVRKDKKGRGELCRRNKRGGLSSAPFILGGRAFQNQSCKGQSPTSSSRVERSGGEKKEGVWLQEPGEGDTLTLDL